MKINPFKKVENLSNHFRNGIQYTHFIQYRNYKQHEQVEVQPNQFDFNRKFFRLTLFELQS